MPPVDISNAHLQHHVRGHGQRRLQHLRMLVRQLLRQLLLHPAGGRRWSGVMWECGSAGTWPEDHYYEAGTSRSSTGRLCVRRHLEQPGIRSSS